MNFKVFSCCIFLLLSNQLFSQSSFNIVNNNSVWNILTNSEGNVITQSIKFSSEDTIIDNLAYKKVFYTYQPNQQNWLQMDLFVREDTLSRKVFMRDMIQGEELIYDFSIELNDTVKIKNVISGPLIELKVVNVDSVFLIDSYRKQYHFESLNWPYIDSWIEGIGSISHGVIYCGYYNTSPVFDLLCFKQNDIVYYMHPNYSSCYYPSVSIMDNKKKNFNVVYNLKNQILQIEILSDYQNYSIELYNLLGERFINLPMSGNVTLNLNDFRLKDGIYFYVIRHKKFIISDKLIVN